MRIYSQDILKGSYSEGLASKFENYTTDDVLDIIKNTLCIDELLIKNMHTNPKIDLEPALFELNYILEIIYTFFMIEFNEQGKSILDSSGEMLSNSNALEFIGYDLWYEIANYMPNDFNREQMKEYRFIWITTVFGVKMTDTIEQLKALRENNSPKEAIDTLPKPEKDIIASITHADYWSSMNSLESGKAYIKVMDAEFSKTINIENNSITIKGRDDVELSLQDVQTSEIIRDIDYTLLKSIYSYIYFNKKHLQGVSFNIKLNDLAKYLGVNPRGVNGKQVIQDIQKFDRIMAVHPDGSKSRILVLLKEDKRNGVLTLASPFFIDLMKAIEDDSTISKTIKGKTKTFTLPAYSYLIKSTINKCKNKEAIAVADYLVTLIEQAGGTGAHIRIDTILERIPILKEKLEGIAANKDKSIILRRTFKKAYELLKQETFIYDKYKDLNITEVLPTITTLSSVINITHQGKAN